MSRSYANVGVLDFYKKLPFNFYGSVDAAAERIISANSIEHYPVLPPFLKKGPTVLDVGCGAGWFVNEMNYYYGRFGCKCTGLDFNPVAVKQAKDVAAKLGIGSDFVVSDLFKYIPEIAYDIVTSIGVLHHTDHCLAGVQHVFRNYVAPGGYALIGLYHRYGREPFLAYFRDLRERGLSEHALFDEFKKLRSAGEDSVHDLSWFYDQVLHPHETQHTLEELLPLLRAENMQLISTSINKFAPFTTERELVNEEKGYYEIAVEKLRNHSYFPGFFVFFAKKDAP